MSETATDSYPSTFAPIRFDRQVRILQRHFPGLHNVQFPGRTPKPDGAEHWFAVPYWPCVAETYAASLKAAAVAAATNGSHLPFYAYLQGKLTDIVPRASTAECMEAVHRLQGHPDIMAIPAQFGLRHSDCSASDTLARIEGSNEFPLGAFAVACMLLTHPHRLNSRLDLSLTCPGDVYKGPHNSPVRGERVVVFDIEHGGRPPTEPGYLRLEDVGTYYRMDNAGNLTAFLPDAA